MDTTTELENDDWTKRTWDLHEITNIDKLRTWLKARGTPFEDFKKLPVYRWNVDKMPWLREL